jgi:SET family sugar efflux transporter-like MFS transporter
MSTFFDRVRPLYSNPSFRTLLLLNLLLGTSTAFVMPFMSMFGMFEVGMSLFAFGAFMTVNALSGIVIASFLAHLSDVRVSRRSMLLAGSLAGAAGYAGYASFRSFTPLLLTGSLVLGVASITFSQLFAYARDLLTRSDLDPSQSAFYINVFRMFIALAWTVGPAVATWIMTRYSFRGIFVGASLSLVAFACLVAWAVPEVPPRPRRARSDAQPVFVLLGRVDVLSHFAAFVLITASTTIGMMNLPLLIMKTLHGREADVGIAYSVAPVFELPFMLYFGWLATRVPAERVIRAGMVISAAYYGCLVLVGAPWQVDLCQGLSAAATSVVSGVAITYFQSHLPDHPGTATNLYANAQRIGSTAGYVFEACMAFALLALALMQVPVHVDVSGREAVEAPRPT